MAGQAPARRRSGCARGPSIWGCGGFSGGFRPGGLQAFGLALRTLEGENASVREASLGDLVAEMQREDERRVDRFVRSGAAPRPNEWRRARAILIRGCWRDIRSGQKIAEPQYRLSLHRRDRLIAAMGQRLNGLGLSHPSTTPRTARDVGGGGRNGLQILNALMLRNPGFANFFDLCAISIPMPIEPMPAGVMLVGRHGADEALLSIARAVEMALSRTARATA